MLCLNKRQCHSVILFSVLHIYTGDTEQRQLRYEAIGGYTGDACCWYLCQWGRWTWWIWSDEPVWFLQVSPLEASGKISTQSYSLCFLMQSLTWLRNWIRKYMQPCMLVAPFWAPSRSPDNKEEETTRLMHFMNVRWARRQNKNRGVRMNGCDTMSTVSGCWQWNEGYGANGSKPSKQAFVNCKVWSLVLHRLVLHWHAFQYWVHSIYAAAASTLIRLSKYAIDTYLYKSLYFLY